MVHDLGRCEVYEAEFFSSFKKTTSKAEAAEKISKTLARRSKASQAPAVALSAGRTGCKRVFRGKI